jgi:CRISPR system Cascade subunit CasD
MNYLILRFDAPMLSFGGPVVDSRGVIQPYPALSMMTGMLGNALGYDHAEFDRLESLQERLAYASRQDRRGEKITDFQTVDFTQEFLQKEYSWTTRGQREGRSTRLSKQTHIRERDYWVDSAHTVAVTLDAADEGPDLGELADSIQHPERPLFIGRKTCLPATHMFVGTREAAGWRDVLRQAPLHPRADDPTCRAWWPCEPGVPDDADHAEPVTDKRDWRNQIHVGERWIAEGDLTVEHEETDHA